jgi:hypothetical protein
LRSWRSRALGGPRPHRSRRSHGLRTTDPEIVLLSIQELRRLDDVQAYFSPDNSYGVDNCLRLPSGVFVPFNPGTYELKIGLAKLAFPLEGEGVNRVRASESLHIHAALCHAGRTRLQLSRITIGGKAPQVPPAPHLCAGCRLAAPKAPAAGGSRPRPTQATSSPREPLTFYGQLVSTDLCTSFPASWPHKFKAMLCFCDGFTKEREFYFQLHSTAAEVASALQAYFWCNANRLKNGGNSGRGKQTTG